MATLTDCITEHRTRIGAGRVVDLEREAAQQRVKEAQKRNVVGGKEKAKHRQGFGRGGAHLVRLVWKKRVAYIKDEFIKG